MKTLEEQFTPGNFSCSQLQLTDDPVILEQAMAWTSKFRNDYPNQKIAGKQVKGYSINRKVIERLLNQDGKEMTGLKIYLGKDENDIFRVVIAATENDNGDDYKVPTQKPAIGTTVGSVDYLGEVRPCPDWCGNSNVVNTNIP